MKLLIISDADSDLSNILKSCADCTMLSLEQAEKSDLSTYSSIALLCGTESLRPVVLRSALRMKIDEFAESGKPIFYEWCASLGYTYIKGFDYSDGSHAGGDAMSRYVYLGKDSENVKRGDLLDSQANTGCFYTFVKEDSYPVLFNGGHIVKHDHIDESEIEKADVKKESWRLWYYDKTQLVCSFRFCNFVKARFSPFRAWCGVLEIILKHLGVEKIKFPTPHYRLGSNCDAKGVFDNGMEWFDGCGIIYNKGLDGADEGLAHTILPDGKQIKKSNIRVDCVGEVAGAYFFDHLLKNDADSFEIFENLSSFIFDKMQVKKGKFAGMLRWTETAWQTVYGDDVGRAILGTLFYMMYTKDLEKLPQIEAALDFLISLTGTDGLMHHGLHAIELTDEKINELHSTPSNQYCAHRNAYYSAALLLAYLLNGKKEYLDTACRGLSTIMGIFPNTMRAISETEELCRLVFPLSCLYKVTKDETHKKWLYDVCARLEGYRHKSGGFTEVDPGYTAYRSRTQGTESSMLADNGNEIADILYSINWLPLGFSYAYYATGDEFFLNEWKKTAKFLSSCQIVSDDKTIHGAWARSLDLKRMEIYGMPHDVGWGPCSIESGWTVGEILMGLGFGIALQKGKYPAY